MQNRLRLLLATALLLASYMGCSQNFRTPLKGTVASLKNDVADVLIINLNSKKSTITDSLGLFTIAVKPNDIIRFSSVQFVSQDIEITAALLAQNKLSVYLIENVIALNEVTVMPYNLSGKIAQDLNRLDLDLGVTSTSLNLPNAGLQKMTQNERLLLEADRGKFVRIATIEDQGKFNQVLGYAALAIVINTHKILNTVSGRTKSLKQAVARDENLALENRIVSLYSKETLADSFNIPIQNIDGFLSFCLAQPDFAAIADAPNTTLLWDYLKQKSMTFKTATLAQD